MTGLEDDCQEALPSHGREDALSGKPVEDTKARSFLECVWLFLVETCLLEDHIFVFVCKS